MPGPICFYADDFTGATGHLGGFYDNGVRSVLFLKTPSLDKLKPYLGEVDVIGVAGIARSLAVEDMQAEIEPALRLFYAAEASHVQYKVCSTFDSAPHIGSIGRAIEIGRHVLGAGTVTISPGDPKLGRYTVFGNHFANLDGSVVRLDRHASLSVHPSTPMQEADLLVHLSRQTDLSGGLIDILALRSGGAETALDKLEREGKAFVLFDSLDGTDFDCIAALVTRRENSSPSFSVVSQGFASACGRLMASNGAAGSTRETKPELVSVKRMLVLSGSASTKTQRQIAAALQAGWTGIRLDVSSLMNPEQINGLMAETCDRMACAFRSGSNVIVYSAEGPADSAMSGSSATASNVASRAIGLAFAHLVEYGANSCGLKRMVLAGGDTSSHTMRNLNADALEIIGSGRHGGRLCRVRSASQFIDGLEIFFKGGQIGGDNAFIEASDGSSWLQS